MTKKMRTFFIKAIFLILPMSYVPAAQAYSDRMGGVVYNSLQFGPAIQFGIISSYDTAHKGVLDGVSNNVPGAIAASGMSRLFNTATPAVAGYRSCDGFYNYIKAGTENQAVIRFNAIPAPPPEDFLTNSQSTTSWLRTMYSTVQPLVVAQNNPCNWIGNGEIWMMIKVPAPYLNTVMDDAGRPDLKTTLNKYSIIAFKLATVKMPW